MIFTWRGLMLILTTSSSKGFHEKWAVGRNKDIEYPTEQALQDLLQAESVFRKARASLKGEVLVPRKKRNDSNVIDADDNCSRSWIQRLSTQMELDGMPIKRKMENNE